MPFPHAKDLGSKKLPTRSRCDNRRARIRARLRADPRNLPNGSVIELALDRGEIDTGEKQFPLSELELELKEGHPRELFRLAHELSASIPLHLAARSKAERGYALIEDGEPNPVEKAGELNITATTSIDDSFKAIAKDCLRQLFANRPAMLGGNSEGLHQMRIGLRRLRTAISLFKNIVAGSDRKRIKTELKWITAELGPARDLDVLNTEVVRPIGEVLHQQGDLQETARQEFQGRRDQAYERARRAVTSARFANAVLEAAEWIEAGQWTAADDPLLKLRREQPIAPHAATELGRRGEKIRKKGKNLRQRDAKQRHKLRIRAKKLRYAIEFFSGLVAGKKKTRRRDAALSSLKDLQSALGSLNDVASREKLMARLATEEDERTGPPFVAGVIYAFEDARSGKLLKQAAKAHKKFSQIKPFWKSSEAAACNVTF